MTDSKIAAFLNARRKFIAGLLGVASVLTAGNLGHPFSPATVIQAIIGFLTVYGIHEIANDQAPPAP